MMPQTASQTSRLINVNSAQQTEKFCSNVVSTAKYSPLSFLPRFLYEQFRRYNNVFFLVIALLQQIPNVSPTGRYTTAVPFLIILSVSAVKEIFEDLKRRTSDSRVNNYYTYVLRGRKWEQTRWRNVAVGDIVRVENEKLFPADLILLSSSEPNGMAYIETSNLDGETNLKIRQAVPATSGLSSVDRIIDLHCVIECEKPNRNVNEFTGTLITNGEQVPLGLNQTLLRGARLKNTRWVFGAVIYTGHDAKLLMNSKAAPLKRSNIDRDTNSRMIVLFFLLITLAILSAAGAYFYESTLFETAFYLGVSGAKTSYFFWNVLTFFILYNNLIPISLQVTLEIVRFFQAVFINNDLEMYDSLTDTPAVARTSNLNEELGQVKFIMSDKTGTLTRNVMKFKRCTIGGVSYGSDDGDKFADPSLIEDVKIKSKNAPVIVEFLRMMALCHTVVPEEDEASNINYQASSPDEAALVRGAADLGVIFHTRKPECVTIDMLGTEETYQVLHVLEFTSSRKRMGVVLRTPDSSIILYVKGADSVIFERLSQPSQFLADTTKHLVEYAEKGYRTLCFATRSIEESFYMQWSQTFHEASVALHSREEKLAACAEQIEKELTLIGATAIEDKLQEHVPETIAALLNADIRIWMLTGDKRETAINIAHASALISSDTTLLILNTPTYDETYSKLLKYNRIAESLTTANARFALIIDARSLHHALMAECQPIMADLTMRCHAVVCCRMSPIQKAEVVDMVRSFGSYTVLAIGDGANDVAMIQAADVGIGISGEEGLQASSASDYSISQFQYLRRLLLVHGAWDFDRSVKVILYSFYKNICLYLIELWFALFSAFSGQTIFERWTIGLFNVIFTACPPIVLGLFDRPVSENLMLTYPSLYFSFQERAFSKPRFGLWIGTAILHSILLFFFSYGFLLHCVVWRNGRAGGWLMLGNSCYSFVIVTVCIKALVECSSWTSIMVIFSVGSIISWFIFLGVYSIIWPLTPLGASMSGMAEIMLSSGVFWLALLIIPFCTLMWDVLYKIIQVNRWPTPRDIATYTEKLENTRAMDTSEGRSLQGVTNEGMVNSYGSIDEETMEVNQNVKQTGEVSSGSTASTESRMESGLVHSAEITNRRSSYLKPFVENARLLEAATAESSGRYSRHVTEPLPEVAETLPEMAETLPETGHERGYAFSQEEGGFVSQTKLVRSYDSTRRKPRGI